jgi:hypothetical protein
LEPECDLGCYSLLNWRKDIIFTAVFDLNCQVFLDLINHHLQYTIGTGHNIGLLRISPNGSELGTLVVHRTEANGIAKAQTLTKFGRNIFSK